jgi:hypothetical protein
VAYARSIDRFQSKGWTLRIWPCVGCYRPTGSSLHELHAALFSLDSVMRSCAVFLKVRSNAGTFSRASGATWG